MQYQRLSDDEFQTIYHKVPRAGVDLVIQTKDGILMTKRAIPPFLGMWHLPGGSILFREPIRHAIDRIAKEELGIEIKVIKLLGVNETLNDGEKHTIVSIYLTEIKKGVPRGSEQGWEIAYFKKAPENCIPEQKKFLDKYLFEL